MATSLASCKNTPTCLPGQQLTSVWDTHLPPGVYPVSYTLYPWGRWKIEYGMTSAIIENHVCEPCPLGTYRPALVSGSGPQACPNGYSYSGYEMQVNKVASGFCCLCPSGTTTLRAGSTDSSQCIEVVRLSPAPTLHPTPPPVPAAPHCPLGSWSTASTITMVSNVYGYVNSHQCMPCKAGSYGYYCTAVNKRDDCGTSTGGMCCYESEVNTNICANCPLGMQTAVIGATSIAQCTVPICPAGTYQPIATQQAAGAADAAMSTAAIAGIAVGVFVLVAGLAALGYLGYVLNEKKLALARQEDLASFSGRASFSKQPRHPGPHGQPYPHPQTSTYPSTYPEYPQYDEDPQQYCPPPGIAWQNRLSLDQSGDRYSSGMRSQRASESRQQQPHVDRQQERQEQQPHTAPSDHQLQTPQHHQQEQKAHTRFSYEISSRTSPNPLSRSNANPDPSPARSSTTRIVVSRAPPSPASHHQQPPQPRTALFSGGIRAGDAGRVGARPRLSNDHSRAHHGL